MSTVIWTSSLVEGKVTSDQDDKPLLMRYCDHLALLRTADGKSLADFIDGTEAQAIVSDDYQGFEDGWELVKHRAKWHAPAEGLRVINAVRAGLAANAARLGLPSEQLRELDDELGRTLAAIEKTASAGGTFNLAIVM